MLSLKKKTVLALYIHNEPSGYDWGLGACSKLWLNNSLKSLNSDYISLGSSLVLKLGCPKEIFSDLLKNNNIEEVCWNKRFEPFVSDQDSEVKKWLENLGIKTSIFNSNYLIDPNEFKNLKGDPYLVFTPFMRSFFSKPTNLQLASNPSSITPHSCKGVCIDDLRLTPKKDWYSSIFSNWKPGRAGAERNLEKFCSNTIECYLDKRNFLYEDGTSKLSPHLAFGEISPREVWHRCIHNQFCKPFLTQILWREFSNYFLLHFPETTNNCWKIKFSKYSWKTNSEKLLKWKKGQTGYPIVDAAMRQLWKTGWMHNRARMIVASFLVKDLHIHWIEGARWFWDTLVDADLANNTMGWQWVAGCGPDAAPYFRIFNPVTQSKKFDPEGQYIKQYLPELANLPSQWIHEPSKAPPLLIRSAGLEMGKDYPFPIVDHAKEREEALKGYSEIK